MASVARRHHELATGIARLDAALEQLLARAAPPEFLAKQGAATQVAATLLATASDNPGRVRWPRPLHQQGGGAADPAGPSPPVGSTPSGHLLAGFLGASAGGLLAGDFFPLSVRHGRSGAGTSLGVATRPDGAWAAQQARGLLMDRSGQIAPLVRQAAHHACAG
jgi:hypothetical protein